MGGVPYSVLFQIYQHALVKGGRSNIFFNVNSDLEKLLKVEKCLIILRLWIDSTRTSMDEIYQVKNIQPEECLLHYSKIITSVNSVGYGGLVGGVQNEWETVSSLVK